MASKVLIIDDHIETRTVVALILKEGGYETMEANSGLNGIAMAEKDRPDLILLDVMMPKMDGYEVCRRFRAHPDLGDIPIILFTVKSEVDDKWVGFEAGADDYVTKPANPEDLLNRIEILLSRAQKAKEPAVPPPPPPAASETEEIKMPAKTGKPRLIAVLGSRGGAGATTLAINMAAALAQSGHPTTLVDLDMIQGHISLYLNQTVRKGLNDLAQLTDDDIKREWRQHLIPIADNLQLLPSQSNLDQRLPLLSSQQAGAILRLIRENGQQAVLDLGYGLSPENLAILKQVDHILLCLKPERVAIIAARKLLSQLYANLAKTKHIYVIMLNFNHEHSPPRQAIEEFLRHPLKAIISIDAKSVAHLINKGKPLIFSQPKSKMATTLRKLAAELLTVKSLKE